MRPGGLRVAVEELPAHRGDLAVTREVQALSRELEKDYRVAVSVALRTLGWDTGRIAEKVGVSRQTVRDYLAYAREHKGLNDTLRDLELRAIPQAIENLIEGLEAKDKDYTLETLKGRGLFRNHSNTKTEGGQSGPLQLQVNFVNAPGVAPPDSGTIHAVPRE